MRRQLRHLGVGHRFVIAEARHRGVKGDLLRLRISFQPSQLLTQSGRLGVQILERSCLTEHFVIPL